MAVVILLSACITGLGLMNLVVGILCNTAFKLEARQSRTLGAERLVSQQEALGLFRQQLLKHGTYLLKNNRQISKEEFTQALEAGLGVKSSLGSAGIVLDILGDEHGDIPF